MHAPVLLLALFIIRAASVALPNLPRIEACPDLTCVAEDEDIVCPLDGCCPVPCAPIGPVGPASIISLIPTSTSTVAPLPTHPIACPMAKRQEGDDGCPPLPIETVAYLD